MHTDFCGPMNTKDLEGELYFILLIDDYIRITWVFFIKKKLEAFECFKTFKEMVENETDLKIKTLRSDNGGEFTSNELWNYCEEHGIKRKSSVARTPQQNGVVEWKNKVVEEMVRTMLNDSKLSDKFWVHEVHIDVHILNRGLLKIKSDETPYGIWKGIPTNVKHFRVFEGKCYIKRQENKSGKFDSRVDVGIFVGYSWNSKE